MNFQQIYETQRQVYQGSTSGTLLETVLTCYNGSPAPCNGTAITLPILRRTVTVQLPNAAGVQSQTDTFYNAYGLPTEVDEYDFGSAAVGPPVRKTLITYASLDNGIINRPASITVQDGLATLKRRRLTPTTKARLPRLRGRRSTEPSVANLGGSVPAET